MDDRPDVALAYEKLLGRAATETERAQLRKIRDALGLRENDALWSVLFALQYYDSLYRQFPKAIAAEAARVMADTRASANAFLRVEIEKTCMDLLRSTASAARTPTQAETENRLLHPGIAGMMIGTLIFAGGLFIGLLWH